MTAIVNNYTNDTMASVPIGQQGATSQPTAGSADLGAHVGEPVSGQGAVREAEEAGAQGTAPDTGGASMK